MPLVSALAAAEQKAVKAREKKLSQAIRDVRRKQKEKELESVSINEAKAKAGVHDVLVIDPPWPMEKIERGLVKKDEASK